MFTSGLAQTSARGRGVSENHERRWSGSCGEVEKGGSRAGVLGNGVESDGGYVGDKSVGGMFEAGRGELDIMGPAAAGLGEVAKDMPDLATFMAPVVRDGSALGPSIHGFDRIGSVRGTAPAAITVGALWEGKGTGASST